MAPIKVGFVGYGWSVRIFHLPFVVPNPDLEVYAFLQRKSSAETARHCTVDYPDARHYRTAQDFFADGAIELVVVCTDTETHFEFAEQALLAGKHVLVEKPFLATSAEADSLTALAKKQNRILTCYQNRRYDSDFLTLQRYVEEGVFGKITEFVNSFDYHVSASQRASLEAKQAVSEDFVNSIGSHTIDQALQLFGRPSSVTGIIYNLLSPNDAFTIILHYTGKHEGLMCTIKSSSVSVLSPAFTPRFTLRGTHGSFLKTGQDCQVEHLTERQLSPTDPEFGVEPASHHAYLATRVDSDKDKFEEPSLPHVVKFDGYVPSRRGCWMDFYRDLVKAIRGEGEVVVRPEESRDGIRVLELARESAEKSVTVAWS